MLAFVTITGPNVAYHHLIVQTKFHYTPNVQVQNYYLALANYSLISSSSPWICKSSTHLIYFYPIISFILLVLVLLIFIYFHFLR